MDTINLERNKGKKMLILISSTLTLIISLFTYRKSRQYLLDMANSFILDVKYQLLGIKESTSDILKSKYNRTDLPCKNGNIAVITGGSRGIGVVVVRMLLQCGMNVVIGCRKVQNGEESIRKIRESGITTGTAKAYELDNSSLASVQQFANNVKYDFDKIHVLINNAGIMFTPYSETNEGIEQQWGVNYLSHFKLTSLLLPLLRNAGASKNSARIVNVSSCAHRLGSIDFDNINFSGEQNFSTKKAYAQSKLAQVIFTRTFQKIFEEKKLPIQIYAVHPGIVNTDLFQNSLIHKFSFLKKILFKTPEGGATGVVFVAVNDKVENRGGAYFSNCLETVYNPLSDDKVIQQKLLQLSLEQTQLKDFFQFL